MDIAAWLRELRLERYEEAFRENEIDAAILTKLTADDLKDLGVNAVGHRRKLLEAIAALAEPASVPQVVQSAPAEAAPRAAPAEAERRQLTVLFCDLVGSTELSARLDPEDMGRVIRAYQHTCTEVIERWGGHVAKYMGDGVLAYYGWPRAHEDGAERAVRSGLAMIEALAELETPAGEPLTARVGIATGLVMVGELIGVGAAQEQTVVGETPNLAARLQTLAQPGSLVISQATRRLIGGLFKLTDLGPRRLKGFAEPLVAFRVEGESRVEGRFEALHGQRLTPLVGREQELAILLERWAWAKDGDGQVVLLAGEPGIGKSRLLRALRQELGGEPHLVLSHFCSPYHINSALHPSIGQLERAAGFAPGDEPEVRRAKLEELLAQATEQLDEAVTLIGVLLGLPADTRYPALNLSPQRQKQRTLEILIDQLAGLARHRPVLELYEDVHWADPSTLELLDLMVERVRALQVLAVLVYRPQFSPPWTGRAHVTSLPLNRLGRRQRAAMVEGISGKALPADVLEQIVARTDGVPLFVEELTKTVLESGLLTEADGHYELAGPLVPLAIPATLQDSLMARLDRFAPVREVAQVGAVIGREFSHEVLAAVSPLSEADLNIALNQLVQSELVFRRGTPPEATYTFKHALVQDAAYQSLLKSKRQQLHAKIGSALEERFPRTVDTAPELLAQHFTQAGQAERAIAYWRAAAQRASERSAHQEAIAHLGKGVELLRELPETQKRNRLELPFQISLGSASLVIGGFAAAPAEEAYTRARELARGLDEQAELFTATWGLWIGNQHRLRVKEGRALANELLAVAEPGADSGRRLQAHHAAWTTLPCVPELVACRHHAERGLALYDPVRHVAHKFQYGGHDPGVCGLAHLGVVEWLLGFPEEAVGHARGAVSLARNLEHGPSLAIALNFNSYVCRFRGEVAAARELSDEQLRLCVEQGIFPQHVAWGRIGRGWALARTGDVEAGLAAMREGLRGIEETRLRRLRAYNMAMFAEACIEAARFDESRWALTDALDSPERWWEPEVHRLRGTLALAMQASASEAGQNFHRALTIARIHQSRSLELRAATSLARLWSEQGRRTEGHDLLAPVYGWFTEGFDTADLKDAKALLDHLS